MWTPLIGGILLLTLGANDREMAQSLFDGIAENLQSSDTISFEYTMALHLFRESDDPRTIMKFRCTAWGKRPNLGRVEMTFQGEKTIAVCDGKSAWSFQEGKPTYRRVSASEAAAVFQDPLSALWGKGSLTLLEQAEAIKVTSEKLGGNECDVVSWYDRGYEWRVWLDGGKKFVRAQELSANVVYEYGRIDLAPVIAPDLFTFSPTKDMEEAPDPERDLLAERTDAPAFEANDLAGKQRKLEEFRGKVVLLFLWEHS